MPDAEVPPATVPAILPPEEQAAAQASDAIGDSMAHRENEWLEQALSGHTIEAAALRNELARAYIKNMEADRDMRTQYAGRILLYLEAYSAGVGTLLLLDGFKFLNFALDTTVVTSLVGSTAVAAIGLVGFIARGLFRPPPPPPDAAKP